jgi:CelD/BcsL family acetyltransferase involved in cellulose biosynthesis
LNQTIAAIRSGTDPVGKLPEAAFHRWLETPLGCPKCDVSYGLVADFEWATARRFDDESRGMVRQLKKAIQMGHSSGHRVSHFETSGVVVKSYSAAEKAGP